MVLEVIFDSSPDDNGEEVRTVIVCERGKGGQLALIDSAEFGPFDTWHDVSKWIYRCIELKAVPMG